MKNSDFNYRGQVANIAGTGITPLANRYNRPNQTIVNNYIQGNSGGGSSCNVSQCGGNLDLKNTLYTDGVTSELIDKTAQEKNSPSSNKYILKWDFNYDPLYPNTLWFHQNIGINKTGDNELVFRKDGRFFILLSLDLELNDVENGDAKYNANKIMSAILIDNDDDNSNNYLKYNVNVKVECFAKGSTTARTILDIEVSLGGTFNSNSFKIPFNYTAIAYDRVVVSLEEVSKRTILDDNGAEVLLRPVKLKNTSQLQLMCLG